MAEFSMRGGSRVANCSCIAFFCRSFFCTLVDRVLSVTLEFTAIGGLSALCIALKCCSLRLLILDLSEWW